MGSHSLGRQTVLKTGVLAGCCDRAKHLCEVIADDLDAINCGVAKFEAIEPLYERIARRWPLTYPVIRKAKVYGTTFALPYPLKKFESLAMFASSRAARLMCLYKWVIGRLWNFYYG
jgi:hypothetical protein